MQNVFRVMLNARINMPDTKAIFQNVKWIEPETNVDE